MKRKTNICQKKNIWRFAFAFLLIIAGTMLSYFKIGNKFLGFSSVGTWLTYVGFIMLSMTVLQSISNKKRLVDERMMYVASKASRITFVGIILFAFVVMVIDGIHPLSTPYSLFMSYFMCGIVLLYLISYKILLKYN